MRRFALCLAVVSGTLLPARRAPAQEAHAGPAPAELRTSATAQRPVRPDVATITLDFTALGFTPQDAGRHVAARADSLRRGLQALGIPRDSLVSRSQWGWWQGRLEVIPAVGTPGYPGYRDTSYRARDAIQVRLHDLTKVGAVIDTALAHGITMISEVRYGATSVEAPQQAAFEEATRRARRQAEGMATAAGVTLGRLLSLTVEPAYPRPYGSSGVLGEVVVPTAMAARGADVGTTVIEPVLAVTATVSMRWELLPRP